jgi:hypothetical protein
LHFFDYLEKEHPELLESAKQQYDAAMATYVQMKDQHQEIFESFYELIRYLDSNPDKYQYRIVIRTFGKDIPLIAEELERKLGWKLDLAEFKQGVLFVNDNPNKGIKNEREMFEFLQNNPRHIAIKDDWDWWYMGGETPRFGKLHLFDSSDQNVVSLFFDDNIRTIVAPFDVAEPKHISVDEALASGLVHQVDTLQALGDPQYFIKILPPYTFWVQVCDPNRKLKLSDSSDRGHIGKN